MKYLIMKWVVSNYQKIRVSIFYRLSRNSYIGRPKILSPTLFEGDGEIEFGNNVQLGYYPSPYFYSATNYIEARKPGSKVIFGNNIIANNGLCIICEGSSIIDSDFHGILPNERNSGKHKSRPVEIHENVFIGSNVRICKGVTIGKNSVVSNGSVVFTDVPENAIVQGNPASILKLIDIGDER
jgi:acetyltransferase-like isoleucine patch superfamily enzyme